jgi:hypothetical protein
MGSSLTDQLRQEPERSSGHQSRDSRQLLDVLAGGEARGRDFFAFGNHVLSEEL